MRCTLCNDQPSLVEDVLGCKTCRDDGTANEIPKSLGMTDLLSTAVTIKPQLANRFLPTPPIRETEYDEKLGEALEPPTKKKGRGRKLVDKLLGK